MLWSKVVLVMLPLLKHCERLQALTHDFVVCCRPNAAELDIACCTFAAPLVGDDRLAALVQSRGWHDKFIHVVWRHDIVPRLLLSPQPLLHSNKFQILPHNAELGLTHHGF